MALGQFQITPQAKAIYISLGNLDHGNNISDGTLNSPSSPNDGSYGVTVYGTWEPGNNNNIQSGGIYVDGIYVQDYYPGWGSPSIQFGVGTDTLSQSCPQGQVCSHTVQLRAITYPDFTGAQNEERTNILTFYVVKTGVLSATLSVARSVNAGSFADDLYTYYINGNTSFSGSGTASKAVSASSSGTNYQVSLTNGMNASLVNTTVNSANASVTTLMATCYAGSTCNVNIPYATQAQLQLR